MTIEEIRKALRRAFRGEGVLWIKGGVTVEK